MVDCRGSHGDASIAIARKHPSLHFIVQDLLHTIETHPPVPAALAERVTYMVHDLFEEQPVKGADVYFFRWIFHNWSDKYCIRILQNLVPALKAGARILINEWCLPEPNTMPISVERQMRYVFPFSRSTIIVPPQSSLQSSFAPLFVLSTCHPLAFSSFSSPSSSAQHIVHYLAC